MMQIDVCRFTFDALCAYDMSRMRLREESLVLRVEAVIKLERATFTNERAEVKPTRAKVDIVSMRVCVCVHVCLCI